MLLNNSLLSGVDPVAHKFDAKAQPEADQAETRWPENSVSAVKTLERDCLQLRLQEPLDVGQRAGLRALSNARMQNLHPLHISAVTGEGLDILRRDCVGTNGIENPDKATTDGITPLMLTPLNPASAPATIAHLLTLNADPFRVNAMGRNALHMAACVCDVPAVLASLVGAGLSPFATWEFEHPKIGHVVVPSPLQMAAKAGRTRNVFYMLSLAHPGEGHVTTAYLMASQSGHVALRDKLFCQFKDVLDAPSLPLVGVWPRDGDYASRTARFRR